MANTIQVGDHTYPVDLSQSGIGVSIAHGKNQAVLSVLAKPKEESLEDLDAASIRINVDMPWPMTDGWQALSGLTITPGSALEIDSQLYFGWHEDGSNNQLVFREMADNGFQLEFQCESRDQPGDTPTLISISAWLPITGVTVNFPDLLRQACEGCDEQDQEEMQRRINNLQIDESLALEILTASFNAKDYGKPTRLSFGLRFPLLQE